MSNDINTLLTEREATHGPYAEKAQLIQHMKFHMHSSPNWNALDADMRESLDMILHKMGRIAYGDYRNCDHWADIIGYTRLILDRLEPAPSLSRDSLATDWGDHY
jgi:RNA polymerase-binding transcription factor DksA